MQFRQVKVLTPGTRYKILYFDQAAYTATYVCIKNNRHAFENAYDYRIRKIYKTIDLVIMRHYEYYLPIFQRDRIQSDMECRAVNLILRNIIGDPTFTYIGAPPLTR